MVKEIHHCDFYNALKIINQDFGLGLDTKYPKKTRPFEERAVTHLYSSESPEYKLDFIPCEWTQAHLDYIQQYGISLETAKRFGRVPISAILSSGKVIELHNEVAFAYTEHLPYVKIVRPFADKRSKWRNTCPKHLLHGESLFPPTVGCFKVVTKSLKDVEVLYEMEVPTCAVMSESAEPFWFEDEARAKFEGALILMDNDEAGKTCAAK